MPELDDEAITITLPADYLDGATDGAVVKVAEAEPEKKPVADDPVADLKGQFEALKGTLNQERSARANAEQRLAETDQHLQTARKEVVTSQLDTVTTGLQAAEAEADAAEKEYSTAFEAGDGAAMARAHRKMASATVKIDRLKEAEGDLKEQTKVEPKREARTQERVSDDPIERFTKGMSAKSSAWIRAHADCVTDPKKNARMIAAHTLAIADDVAVDSDEYFARIEAGIEPKATVRAAQAEAPAKPAAQVRPSSAAAPAGNMSGGMNGGTVDVSLSQREKISATDGTVVWNYDDPSPQKKFKKGDPIGVQEMGRRKYIMQKQGLYDRTMTES